MKKQLLETISLISKINNFLDHKDFDFDSEDTLKTIESSQKKLSNFLDELKKTNLDNKNKINELMVHIELEYSNFVWAFQEIRDYINRALIKY